VHNSSGTALAGVSVTVKDSSGISTTTDASGAFSISTVPLQLEPRTVSGWKVIVVGGNELEVRSPVEGTLSISLIDGSGRMLWSATSVVSNGTAHASLPSGLRHGAAYLRIRHSQGEFAQAVTTGAEGVEVASHLAMARAENIPSSFPVLLFHKANYHDTSFQMTAASQSGIAVTMSDSTVVTTTCPAATLASGKDYTRSVTAGGVSRSYILHIPSGYKGTEGVPLVVDFHPIGGSASGEEGSSPYKSYADQEGAITAYPDGLKGPSGMQAWNVQGCCTTADDTSFARAVVADVEKVLCINKKRVYAVGFSMGGGMTHYSACHLADIFAAAAPAAFDLLTQNVDACKPARPISLMIFRSTGDGTVPYAGGHSAFVPGMAIDFLGAKATFAKWAELNQCTGSPSAEDANGCATYSTCKDGVQVTLCTKQGGSHEYGNAAVGWPFLKKYTLP
jgi:polyhydroxybutyrate depolymerase